MIYLSNLILLNEYSKFRLNIPSDIKNIHKLFKKNKKKLFVVGGAVRDAILGKNPKDFDLATDAKPDEVLAIAKKGGLKTVEVGKQFGVVIVGGHEIATFRKDIGKGRRPSSVDYTDIEGDVKRRDLTINALFYDMDRGEIVDLVGGVADLKKKKIRTVGKATERFDTIEDVFKSSVEALEDLSDLFRKHAPTERVISSALEKQAMMVRKMITRSKSYKDIKDIRND